MAGRVAACIVAIISIGASGMTAQATLLREFLSQFAGSELYIGMVIGNWIAAEALGAFAAGRLMKDSSRLFPRFLGLTILFSLLFPVMLYLARTWRVAAALPANEAAGLWQILAASIILIFPLAILHGGQFVLAVSMYARLTGKDAESPGRVYGLETVGTVIGGSAASFLFIPLLSPFQTAGILLLLNGLIAFFLRRVTPLSVKHSSPAIFITPLFAALLLLSGGAEFFDRLSLKQQWSGEMLVAAKNSLYQNLAVVRSGEQQTFYSGGAPILSLPYPDIARVEESVHLPLLAHPAPRRVLLLGGGAGGVISEVFKHPTVEWVDYVELDPALIELIEKYSPGSLRKELHNPRVHIHIRDGRAFLSETAGRYDVVLVEMPLPLNLQGNRYFTAEFFAAVERVLQPDGVAAFGSAGSMSYYGKDLGEITRSLVSTVKGAFPHLLVVPGERNLFIFSGKVPVEKLNAEILAQRLEARAVQAALISPPHLHWLFSDAPRQWFQQNVGEGGVVNRDFSPHILTKHLFYTTTRLNPGIKPFLELLGELRTAHLAAFIIATTIFIVILAGNRSRVAVNWMIATTGFTAMLLELAFFCIFQLSQGVMLRTLGFLVAVFMTGLWGGSRISSGAPASPGGDAQRLFAGEAVLLVLCGLLWAISTGGSMAAALTAAPYLLLLPLIFLAGLAAGMQFPPAARATTDGFVPGTAQVYGFDLLGGWLGGLFGGALLLPLLGFADVAVLLLVLKGGSILCLYLNWKRDKI